MRDTRRRRGIGLGVLGGLLVLYGTAAGQHPDELYQWGQRAFAAGDYASALRHLSCYEYVAGGSLSPGFRREVQDARNYAAEVVNARMAAGEHLERLGATVVIEWYSDGKFDGMHGPAPQRQRYRVPRAMRSKPRLSSRRW